MTTAIQEYREVYDRTRAYDILKPTAPNSAAAGLWATRWPSVGFPLPGKYPVAPTACDYDTPGSLTYAKPAVGQVVQIINATLRSSLVGGLYILDRMIHTQPIDMKISTPQTIASVVLPMRADSGSKLELWMEITTATNANATGQVEVTYEDSLGSTGNISIAFPLIVAMGIGTAVRIPLQATTRGIKKITSVQFSSGWTTGLASFVIAKRIATIPNAAIASRTVMGTLALGYSTFDADSCIYFCCNGSTTTSSAVNALLECTRIEE